MLVNLYEPCFSAIPPHMQLNRYQQSYTPACARASQDNSAVKAVAISFHVDMASSRLLCLERLIFEGDMSAACTMVDT